MAKSIELIQKIVLKLENHSITNLEFEKYNSDYEATKFKIDEISYRSRLAKLTPKKKGYFVVL